MSDRKDAVSRQRVRLLSGVNPLLRIRFALEMFMPKPAAPVLLTVEDAANCLSTTPRFVRRLVAERRVRFFKIGRHVRFNQDDLAAFVMSGVVEPIDRQCRRSPSSPEHRD